MTGQMICHPAVSRQEEKMYYFRKTFVWNHPTAARVCLMADARYKLWLNGIFVSAGPCKGSRHLRYYDEVDLTPYLRAGKNTFAVTVLNLAPSDSLDTAQIHIASVLRNGDGWFWMSGTVSDGGQETLLATDGTWEVAEERHVRFTPQFFVGLNEHITAGYGKELTWVSAKQIPAPVRIMGDNLPFGEALSNYAQARPIPPMLYRPREFSFHDGYYDAGELMTGYIRLRARGEGRITLTYGECFVTGDNRSFAKGDRTDTTKTLLGHDDTFEVSGELDFESFWFRTFRFVHVVCEGSAEVTALTYAETGYPLEIEEGYDFGQECDNALWKISARTLKRCMQETYVDCPYYEQLQYCMDTYSEILYTYMVTSDTRLAHRALDDFAATWRPGYITEARAPSCKRQYIPGFSLFFIYMVNMYEARTGDTDAIRPYLPIVDGILSYFAVHRNEAGLVSVSDMWDFVDWADDWRAAEGAPVTGNNEGIAVYTMMYAHALRKAARLSRLVGRGTDAEEYLLRAEEVLEQVKSSCYNRETGLFADSEKKTQYSQHAQIWATLAGLVKGQEAQDILKASLHLSAQGGYAYAYLWFRALETAGCYEELSSTMMQQFYGLLAQHCSTVPETPYPHTRSECHAWGAVALYEFTTMILGVKLRDDSPRILHIAPRPMGRTHAKGCVYTKFGRVEIAWEVRDDTFILSVNAPDTAACSVSAPAGYRDYRISLNGQDIPPDSID